MAANASHQLDCFSEPVNFYMFSLFAVVTVLLLPLSMYVLYVGFSQWKQHLPASHLDHFTFHMAAMEMIPLCGCVMFYVGDDYDREDSVDSLGLLSPNWTAKLHFNTLTCVERYLAVVHPITYLGLKKRGRGVVIRNASIGFLWLLCLTGVALDFVSDNYFSISYMFHGIISLVSLCVAFVITSFCNLAVLRVLIRPRPGEGGGNKAKVDLLKMRAFHTVAAISGVLFWGTCGMLVFEILILTTTLNDCVFINACVWFTLPCSLVLPLLFLNRLGKFSF